MRNQHPAQLLAAHLDPVPAQVLPRGEGAVRFDNAYTSLWLIYDDRTTANGLFLDGEIWRTALDLRLGLGGGVELEAELPFGYATGGFLDGFVIDWHDTFGFPDQDRSTNPRNRFAVEAVRNGRSAFTVAPNEFQLMDVPLGLRVRVLGDDRAALAVRGTVELPTGDQAAGFGNGGLDAALGVVGDVNFDAVSLFAHGHYSFVHDSHAARRAGFDMRDITAFGCGGSVRVSEGLSLHAQTKWETSVLRDLGFDRAANTQWLLWAGFRVAVSDQTFVELALGEDIGPYVSPDFTVWASLSTQFGADAGGPLP